MSARVRVLVADDSAAFRRALGMVLALSDRVELVGEAVDGQDAIARAATCRPDVVLLDLAMPVLDGLEALPEIRRVAPEATVIVLSAFEARAMAQHARELGAAGYLEKGAAPEAIIDAVTSGADRAARECSPTASRQALQAPGHTPDTRG